GSWRTCRGGWGRPPDLGASGSEGNGSRTMRSEVCPRGGVWPVCLGGVDYPLDSPPLWRYRANNGLQHPTVPAVEKLRQAIADAEKNEAVDRRLFIRGRVNAFSLHCASSPQLLRFG